LFSVKLSFAYRFRLPDPVDVSHFPDVGEMEPQMNLHCLHFAVTDSAPLNPDGVEEAR
jgi:hypothetical protein